MSFSRIPMYKVVCEFCDTTLDFFAFSGEEEHIYDAEKKHLDECPELQPEKITLEEARRRFEESKKRIMNEK